MQMKRIHSCLEEWHAVTMTSHKCHEIVNRSFLNWPSIGHYIDIPHPFCNSSSRPVSNTSGICQFVLCCVMRKETPFLIRFNIFHIALSILSTTDYWISNVEYRDIESLYHGLMTQYCQLSAVFFLRWL